MEINSTATPKTTRVSAFIDGFNLYHSIDDIGRNELKWLNLRSVLEVFIDSKIHRLGPIYYFSAYADWKPGKQRRHEVYVRALRHIGVIPVMGNFKSRSMECRHCHTRWITHEEKQSDVNLAVTLVREAFHDSYDQAFIVSGDADLAPPIKLVNEIFPKKRIKIICPPGRRHSKELGELVHATRGRSKIKEIHLERNLLPERIAVPDGNDIVRPAKYSPPDR